MKEVYGQRYQTGTKLWCCPKILGNHMKSSWQMHKLALITGEHKRSLKWSLRKKAELNLICTTLASGSANDLWVSYWVDKAGCSQAKSTAFHLYEQPHESNLASFDDGNEDGDSSNKEDAATCYCCWLCIR